ncbi:MAG TPA: hypothetical protein DCO77_10780 [Nitrospiraceae bacterium]|nr:hypothetical protein [Nitrospiraceae bacterium]
MKRNALLIGLIVLIQGCSYAISSDVASQADKTVSFDRLFIEPEVYKGTIVIFGGTIIRTKSTKQGTLIEVEQQPLDYWGKPERTGQTKGRFIVRHPRYLDAMAYSPGREITMAGKVAGTFEPSLIEKGITLPLLMSRELKLWEREKSAKEQPQWWDPLRYDPSGRGRSVY